MRLARPTLHVDEGFKCRLEDAAMDAEGDGGAAAAGPGPGPGPGPGAERGVWASRVVPEEGEWALPPVLDGTLVLPQSFGAIYLGETFRSYVSLCNNGAHPVKAVSIRAELQTERQRKSLFDNHAGPIPVLEPGARHDFIVQHDLKELGAHTLICSVMYTDADGERKYLPQYFKFSSMNPLVVRMKVRDIDRDTFVEACLENATKDPILLDTVKFDPAAAYALERVGPAPRPPSAQFDLDAYLADLQLLEPGGGAKHYVFKLRRKAEGAPGEGQNALGKLEIRWKGTMGGTGKLQTQQIVGSKRPEREVRISLLSVPDRVAAEAPFTLGVAVENRTGKAVGPVRLALQPKDDSSGILVNGLCAQTVERLDPAASASLDLPLIAIRTGVQRLGDLVLTDTRDDRVLDTLSGASIEVRSSG